MPDQNAYLTFVPQADNVSFDPEQHPEVAWHWRAVYKDFSFLDEYGPSGPYGWKDINQADLACFILIPQRPGLTWHQLRITENSRPIMFRRRHMELATPEQDAETGELKPAEGGLDMRIHVLGFQQTIQGVNVQSLTAYFEDGSSLVTDDIDSF